jgi:hypothetical protein
MAKPFRTCTTRDLDRAANGQPRTNRQRATRLRVFKGGHATKIVSVFEPDARILRRMESPRVEGQLVVAHVEHLLEKSRPQDLLGGKTLAHLLHADRHPARSCRNAPRRNVAASSTRLTSTSSAARACSAMLGESGSWSWWSRRIEGLVVLRRALASSPEQPRALGSIAITEPAVLVCLREVAVPDAIRLIRPLTGCVTIRVTPPR